MARLRNPNAKGTKAGKSLVTGKKVTLTARDKAAIAAKKASEKKDPSEGKSAFQKRAHQRQMRNKYGKK